MTYKDLLRTCKNQPGCLSTKEQTKSDTEMRYSIWKDKINDIYKKDKLK